ncbi:MAG: tetratricopeptide repeat protein [Bacteroidota bacterium]
MNVPTWLKISLLLVGFTLFSISGRGQNPTEDSLLNLLETANAKEIVELHFHLWEATAYSDPEKAQTYADQSLTLAKELNDPRLIGTAYQKLASSALNSNDLERAEANYALSTTQYESIQHVNGIMDNLFNMGIIHYYRGDYSAALDAFETSKQAGASIDDSLHVAVTLNSIGLLHNQQGNFVLGEKALYESAQLFRTSPDQARYADALNYLSASLIGQGKHEDAIELVEQGIEIYEELGDKLFKAQSLNDLGYNQLYLKRFDEAEQNLRACLELSYEVDSKILVGTALSNLGLIQEKKGQLDSARVYLGQSEPIFEELGLLQKELADEIHIVRIALKQNRLAEAEAGLKTAIPRIDSSAFKDIKREAYAAMADLQKRKGNYQLASEYQDLLLAVKDSILNQEKTRSLNEMQTIYQTAEKDREIKSLEQQAILDDLKRQRLLISLILLGLIAALIVYLLIYRARKAAQIRQTEADREAIQRRNLELEKQQLQQNLDYKQKELTGEVLSMTRQQEKLTAFIESLEQFKKICDAGQAFQIEKMIRQWKQEADADPDWDRFLDTFREVHADFIEALQQDFGRFTSSELRLASLLKMNLSSKEIASVLHISDEGVKKARYRLRKKLQLSSEADLQAFLLGYPKVNRT